MFGRLADGTLGYSDVPVLVEVVDSIFTDGFEED